jgi:hypothetical protein
MSDKINPAIFDRCSACGLHHDPRYYCHECGGTIRPVKDLSECELLAFEEMTDEAGKAL